MKKILSIIIIIFSISKALIGQNIENNNVTKLTFKFDECFNWNIENNVSSYTSDRFKQKLSMGNGGTTVFKDVMINEELKEITFLLLGDSQQILTFLDEYSLPTPKQYKDIKCKYCPNKELYEQHSIIDANNTKK